jgi:hypothetical protein
MKPTNTKIKIRIPEMRLSRLVVSNLIKISSVVCFLLGGSPASIIEIQTFRKGQSVLKFKLQTPVNHPEVYNIRNMAEVCNKK